MQAKTLLPTALLALLLPALCRGQDKSMRDHLGTRVIAQAGDIVLDWDPKHPWSADLARGATLIAEYNTRNQGLVLQMLAKGKRAGENTSMRFPLPAQLTVPATGAVCLFIQLSNGRMLPLRKGGDQHVETARFRDAPWEAQATARTADTAKQQTVAAAQAAADAVDHAVALEREIIDRRGVAGASGCSAVSVPSFASERPSDVLTPADIPDGARRACITRVRYAAAEMLAEASAAADPDRKLDAMAGWLSRAVMPPEWIVGLLKIAKLPPDATRSRQLEEFGRDWARFSDHTDAPPHLLLGDEQDFISLQTLTIKLSAPGVLRPLIAEVLGIRLSSEELTHIDSDAVAGFSGGELEAYSRCVVDSGHQLQNKLDEWNENQRRAPGLGEAARKQLIAVCQQDFGRLESLLAQQKQVHEQLKAAMDAAHGEAAAVTANTAPAVLNDVSCAPKQ